MQCPQISNEKKTEVLPLWRITFDPLKNRFKNIHQWSKTCIFFHQKSEGIAFVFCRYLNQNMRAFTFCKYCPTIVFYPQIWMTKMNSKVEGNTLGILRRSFFPFNAFGMPSFNNSVATVVKCRLQGVKLIAEASQSLFEFQNSFLDQEISSII